MACRSGFRWSAGIVALVLAGCMGLPRDLVERAGLADSRIAEESRRVESLGDQYEEFRGSSEFAALEDYAEREEWSQHIEAARAKVRSAEDIYESSVLPLVERDEPGTAGELAEALGKINPLLAGAHESARRWADRRDFLDEVAQRADEMVAECGSSVGAMNELRPQLAEKIRQVRRDHAGRGDEIDDLAGPLSELAASAGGLLGEAQAELRKRGSGDEFDLAVLGDSCRNAGAISADYLKRAPEVSAKLAELDRSYSLTLMDMKVEYELTVRRESWDDSRDYPQTAFLDYRVRNVSVATFEHLTAIRGSLVRSYRSRLINREPIMLSGTDRAQWNLLGLDLYARWPPSHNRAEYWVQGAEAHFFHKYLRQENGETQESDWTEVTADFYNANINNLGMDVESKPYGAFDSEKLTQAAPPGMAYVGNPHYGRWTSDGSGGSVWTWVAPYLFYSTLFGSRRSYERSEWDTWSGGYRGRRPFYGGSSAAPKWGTNSQSTRTSPRMQGSTFARGGGFRRPPTTVRGAGPSTRSTFSGSSGK